MTPSAYPPHKASAGVAIAIHALFPIRQFAGALEGVALKGLPDLILAICVALTLAPLESRSVPSFAPSAIIILSQEANDLAYNPNDGRLYVSGAAGGISVINPSLVLAETNWPMPSEPTRLALSWDAQYLYAAFDAGRRVGRLRTTNGALELDFSLGTNGSTPFVLVDMAVVPGVSSSLAVSKQAGAARWIQILDDGAMRPGLQSSAIVKNLEFGTDPCLLYGTGIRQFVIGSTNLTERASAISAVANEDLEFAGGCFYTTGGKRVEALSRVIVGTCPGLGTGTLVEPDAASGRVFFLTRLDSTWQVRAYDLVFGRLWEGLQLGPIIKRTH